MLVCLNWLCVRSNSRLDLTCFPLQTAAPPEARLCSGRNGRPDEHIYRYQMLALLFAVSSSSPAAIQKIAVKVAGWPDLPYPFSEGILSCAACPEVPCTLKISGNQGYDHAAGHLVTGGIVNETAYALANIKSIAEAAGAKMDDLVSCVVWLANITDFGAMNEVYSTFFTKPYPTRTTTAVALAGSAAVEITCEAVAPCRP